MVDIPMRSAGAVDKGSVMSINQIKVQGARDKNNVLELNKAVNRNAPAQGSPGASVNPYGRPGAAVQSRGAAANPSAAAQSRGTAADPPGYRGGPAQNHNTGANPPGRPGGTVSPASQQTAPVRGMALPRLVNVARKGQKIALESSGRLTKIKACLGWNVKNAACDVDVSAFLLSGTRVVSDDWFVFYGQPESPDKSTIFSADGGTDRETVTIDFSRLNANVDKIVFVLTIHEALEKRLNFSMIQDAYIRIMDSGSNKELVSFMMDEYYDNVTSMMIGEVYKHNGLWKFNAVGNGVARDLAGLCELYGVQVD